jgi:cytochrome c oxidase subunit 3
VFIAMQGFEWSGQPLRCSTGVYSSLYFTITGFHILHVMVGLLMLAVLLLWTRSAISMPIGIPRRRSE